MAVLVGVTVFFLIIALTLVFGAVSKVGDRRTLLEGRPTKNQRPPMRGDVPAHNT
jgi:hypothetical protein